jgi:hypothetical protein
MIMPVYEPSRFLASGFKLEDKSSQNSVILIFFERIKGEYLHEQCDKAHVEILLGVADVFHVLRGPSESRDFRVLD